MLTEKTEIYNFICKIYEQKIDKKKFTSITEKCLNLLRLNEIIIPEHKWSYDFKKNDYFIKHLSLYTYIYEKELCSNRIGSIEDLEQFQKLWSFLALFHCFYQKKDNDNLHTPFVLCSLRLNGVRRILHPHSSDESITTLSALYVKIYLMMRSLSLSFLLLNNHSPFSELAVTLSRATLLMNFEIVKDATKILEKLNHYVQKIHPALSLEMRMVNITEDDFLEYHLDEKTYSCNLSNHTKISEIQDFYDTHTQHLEMFFEYTLNDFQNVLQKNSTIQIYFDLNSTDLKKKLPIIFSPFVTLPSSDPVNKIEISKKIIIPVTQEISKNHLSYIPLKDLHNQKNNSSYAILRIDVCSFLENMASFSNGILYRQQMYRLFHQKFFLQHIPYLISSINKTIPSHCHILIMHSILDDCICFGRAIDLECLFTNMKKDYELLWKGSLKSGLGLVKKHSTAAEISYEALSHMRVKKKS